MCHQVHRLGANDGIDLGIELIDTLMQCHGAAGRFTRFGHSVFDLDNVAGYNIPTGNVSRRDQEVVAIAPSHRNCSIGRDHQPLVTRPANDVDHVGPDGSLIRRMVDIHRMSHVGGQMVHILRHLFIGEVFYLPQSLGIHNGAATELQCFKALIGIHQVHSAQYNAVILHDDRLVIAFPEFIGNFFTQIFAPRSPVGCEADVTADIVCLRNNLCIGNDTGNAESDQCRRMCMNDGCQFRTCLVDCLVKG